MMKPGVPLSMLDNQEPLLETVDAAEPMEATPILAEQAPVPSISVVVEAPVESAPAETTPARPATSRTIQFIALPISSSQLLKKHSSNHPGLLATPYASLLSMTDRQLDYQFDQEILRRIWQKTAHALNTSQELKKEWEIQKARRKKWQQALNARVFSMQTQAPLMVESSQILGHIGLELHPLYGFPYLPAARLKGLVREYAETHWLPLQADSEQASQQIRQILGGAANKSGDSGSVVFHDAWPEQWPGVQTDLNACHHRPYYQRREAAGDWQVPDPRYFLSLRSGARFGFTLSGRRPGQESELTLVETWLSEALATQGYGNGRQSGNGLMKPTHVQALPKTSAASFQAELSLNTPGFYRGAGTRSDDCQLRGSSLRGLLRWWWRTLYSGFLPQRSLVLLENALWGNRGKKGAIRLSLQPVSPIQVRRFQEYDLVKQMPAPEHPKTKPGLSYLTYGTGDNQERAYYLAAGSRWQVSLSCDTAQLLAGGEHQGVRIPAETVLEQAKAALWLLCQYGGTGQRMRKGLGSLQTPPELEGNLDQWLQAAENLREQCGFSSQFQDRYCDSPALLQRIELADILTPWKNEWFALHLVGYAYQSFMQAHKHQALKQGLGLPREIGEPVQGEFQLQAPVKDRYASPLWVHLERQAETGNLIVRMVAFPSKHLDSLESNQALLGELLRHIRTELNQAIENYPLEPEISLVSEERKPRPVRGERRPTFRPSPKPVGGFTPTPPGEEGADKNEGRRRPERTQAERPKREFRADRAPRPDSSGDGTQRKPRREGTEKKQTFRPRADAGSFKSPRPSAPRPVQAGDRIEAALLEERTKKGGWRAQHGTSGLSGPIVNSGLVPGELAIGDSLTLIVHSVNRFEMAFRVPTAADEANQKGKNKKSRAEV
jgi:CRISPR-associated protein Cmr6